MLFSEYNWLSRAEAAAIPISSERSQLTDESATKPVDIPGSDAQ
jgi:hypothetical protein